MKAFFSKLLLLTLTVSSVFVGHESRAVDDQKLERNFENKLERTQEIEESQTETLNLPEKRDRQSLKIEMIAAELEVEKEIALLSEPEEKLERPTVPDQNNQYENEKIEIFDNNFVIASSENLNLTNTSNLTESLGINIENYLYDPNGSPIKVVTTAYYSPLPCQERYATGDYESEKRLNGNGTNGADGTEVYVGMLAAPKSIPFDTKIEIPGLGVGTVHDRGGAIIEGEDYIRVDIWMGYGDAGLNRALQWGKRTHNGVIYPSGSGVTEQIVLSGFDPEEKIPNKCEREEAPIPNPNTANSISENSVAQNSEKKKSELNESSLQIAETTTVVNSDPNNPLLSFDLGKGDSGSEVQKLQENLKKIHYFNHEITGFYGEVTEHAVYKFQQSVYLVGDKNSPGAGKIGPKTRDVLNEIIVSGNYYQDQFKVSSESLGELSSELSESKPDAENESKSETQKENNNQNFQITKELDPGISDPEVKKLQELLKNLGYFNGSFTTEYYGEQTKKSVLQFQLSEQLISSEEEQGAGRVGPSTLERLNQLAKN